MKLAARYGTRVNILGTTETRRFERDKSLKREDRLASTAPDLSLRSRGFSREDLIDFQREI